MTSIKSFLLVLIVIKSISCIVGPNQNSTKLIQNEPKTDSYLDAYSQSRIEAEQAKQGVTIVTAKEGEKKISNREDTNSYNTDFDYQPQYASGGYPAADYGTPTSGSGSNYIPPNKYDSPPNYPATNFNNNGFSPSSPAAANYGPPAQSYGPPVHQSYGPPAHTYGPPANTYGPPTYKTVKPVYGVPYTAPSFPGLPGFFDKLAFKMDLLTLAKIILKIVIFKKIVKFIAVICLLLFIPKLIHKKSNDGDADDGYRKIEKEAQLTSFQTFLEGALDTYAEKQEGCEGFRCRMSRVLDSVDQEYPYSKISNYVTIILRTSKKKNPKRRSKS